MHARLRQCLGPTGKSLGQQPHDGTAVGRTPGKYSSSLSPPVFRLSSLSNVAMEGKHLVVLCNLSFGDKTIASHALIDCGATGISFVDEDFARHHQLPLTPLKQPRALEVIDSRPISSGDITHAANVTLSIHEHREELPMFVTKLGHYPIVLGIPWMELHDVAIRFSSRTLTFGS